MPSKSITHLLPASQPIEPYDPNKVFNASWKQLLNPFKIFSWKNLRYRTFTERCMDLIQFIFGSNSSAHPNGSAPLSYLFHGQAIYHSLAYLPPDNSPFSFDPKEAISALSISDYLSLGIFPALTYLINRLVGKISSLVTSRDKFLLHNGLVILFLFPVLVIRVFLNFVLLAISFPLVCLIHLIISLFPQQDKKEHLNTTEEIIEDAQATRPGHLITCEYISYQSLRQYLQGLILILDSPQEGKSYHTYKSLIDELPPLLIHRAAPKIGKAYSVFLHQFDHFHLDTPTIKIEEKIERLKRAAEKLLGIIPSNTIVVHQEYTHPLGYYLNPCFYRVRIAPTLLTEIPITYHEHLFFSSKNENKESKYLIQRIKNGEIKAGSSLLDSIARAEAIDILAKKIPAAVMPQDVFLHHHVCSFL